MNIPCILLALGPIRLDYFNLDFLDLLAIQRSMNLARAIVWPRSQHGFYARGKTPNSGAASAIVTPLKVSLVIGAAILCCLLSAADAGAQDTSAGRSGNARMAAGRTVGTGVRDDLNLPAVLSTADAERYRQALALDRAQRFADADRQLKGVGDRLLVGVVLAQRYLEDGYKPSAAELADWLRQYRDLPQAAAIHNMAQKSRAKRGQLPGPVREETSDFGGESMSPVSSRVPVPTKSRSTAQSVLVQKYDAQLKRLVRQGEPRQAAAILDKPEIRDALSTAEFDDWRRRVAWGYFLEGEDEQALKYAAAAAERSRAHVPQADWVAGLAAFRLSRFDNAQHHFEELAASRTAISWDNTAGAYWGGRVALKLRQPNEAVRLWRIAAEQPRTFYGLLALRQLGRPLPFDWTPPPLPPDQLARLMRLDGARRAIALAEIGEQSLSEREIARLQAGNRDEMVSALLGLAVRIGTPAAQYRLGQLWRDNRNQRYDTALYPLPPWEPAGGYQVDRALVFAFMRQESGFNARARSSAGASGLMQLMPATASRIDPMGLPANQRKAQIFAPEYNIDLGQRYLQRLMDTSLVGQNLIFLAAAYNAGPGGVQRWREAIEHREDPLIFIESVPVAETRNFIMRVLANFWIYRDRLGLPTMSLDQVASNRWPLYEGQGARAGTTGKTAAR